MQRILFHAQHFNRDIDRNRRLILRQFVCSRDFESDIFIIIYRVKAFIGRSRQSFGINDKKFGVVHFRICMCILIHVSEKICKSLQKHSPFFKSSFSFVRLCPCGKACRHKIPLSFFGHRRALRFHRAACRKFRLCGTVRFSVGHRLCRTISGEK